MSNPSKSKQAAHHFCVRYVQLRVDRLHAEIEKITEALLSEVKSTAGDKHGTGRALLQLEREKLGYQLLEAERMQQTLQKVPLKTRTNKVGLGSLVSTDRAWYYIAISAGRLEMDGRSIFCVSANAPIGKLLLGKTLADTITFNGQSSTITAIQ